MSLTTDTPTREPDPPRTGGTLRWQAPELMAGGESKFLASMDVYAFGICCVEILTNGSIPWPLIDDEVVKCLVLSAFTFTLLLAFTNLRSSTVCRGEQKTIYPE